MTRLTPSTVEELAEAISTTPRVLPVGARTKPRLSQVEEVTFVTTGKLAGITEYDPSEFTFTALAGTPLHVIAAALAERGQYLPFDPLLVDAGATLGGTVAAGVSGPGRFRYGGLRDFILGVRFVDGVGRLMRMGGKVVKNAAGFDLPKFFVGSLGRFGVLAELTFKVFPRVPAFVTARLPFANIAEAVEMICTMSSGRWEIDALDVSLQQSATYARIGPEPAAEALATEILARFPGGSLLEPGESDGFWRDVREFGWASPDGVLVKVPLTPKLLPNFAAVIGRVEGARGHVSGGGAVGFLSVPGAPSELDSLLVEHGLRGMTLRGDAPLWLGLSPRPKIEAAVKRALDPHDRFPTLDS